MPRQESTGRSRLHAPARGGRSPPLAPGRTPPLESIRSLLESVPKETAAAAATAAIVVVVGAHAGSHLRRYGTAVHRRDSRHDGRTHAHRRLAGFVVVPASWCGRYCRYTRTRLRSRRQQLENETNETQCTYST